MDATMSDAKGVSNGSDVSRLAVGVDGAYLPTQEIVTGRTFVAGKSSSGKSNTATVVSEELLDRGIPLAIVDPEGEYRALADEYPVVIASAGGDGDVDADSESLRDLGRRAVAESLPIVLDTSDAAGLEEEQELAGAFVSGIYRAGQHHQKPYLVVVDEFHDFSPNREKTPATKPLERVAKRGRKRGIGLFALSQRPADVATEMLAQADTQVWHRLTWDNDLDRARSQLGGGRTDQLPNVDDGEAFVLADYLDDVARIQFRRQRVEDLGSTPDVSRSLGSVPTTVPSDISAGTTSEREETPEETREFVERTIATYNAYEKNDGTTTYAQVGGDVVEYLGATDEDTIAVEQDGDELVLDVADHGEWTYNAWTRSGSGKVMFNLGSGACGALGAQPGDTLRFKTAERGVRVEIVDGGGQ